MLPPSLLSGSREAPLSLDNAHFMLCVFSEGLTRWATAARCWKLRVATLCSVCDHRRTPEYFGWPGETSLLKRLVRKYETEAQSLKAIVRTQIPARSIFKPRRDLSKGGGDSRAPFTQEAYHDMLQHLRTSRAKVRTVKESMQSASSSILCAEIADQVGDFAHRSTYARYMKECSDLQDLALAHKISNLREKGEFHGVAVGADESPFKFQGRTRFQATRSSHYNTSLNRIMQPSDVAPQPSHAANVVH